MNILLVTEKYNPGTTERDGGSRLAATLKSAFGDSLKVMQFGDQKTSSATWHFKYPFYDNDRFNRRVKNATFIQEKLHHVIDQFSHIIFIHVSMLFNFARESKNNNVTIILFPMFLSPSYKLSGETIPKQYVTMEHDALTLPNLILTPSYFEKDQLITTFNVSDSLIKVIPRGIDTNYVNSYAKTIEASVNFCSIGSIKPQKNTLELISLFSSIHKAYKNSCLKIIGPIQNEHYFQLVIEKINQLGLKDSIELTGFVKPNDIPNQVKKSHFHLSTSHCETFGRSIFETLALGIPNIVRRKNNAAFDFLCESPFIQFVDNNHEATISLNKMMQNYNTLSKRSTEIGTLFDDKLLSKILAAEISQQKIIAISDFDGTLYHKDCTKRTIQCMKEFSRYPIRVICSARSVDDILKQCQNHNISVDWIIAYSGAVVCDGAGNKCWSIPIDSDIHEMIRNTAEVEKISFDGDLVQLAVSSSLQHNNYELRAESYSGITFLANVESRKLHAIIKLLNHINHQGRVHVSGDGKYDHEMITYFDGNLVTS